MTGVGSNVVFHRNRQNRKWREKDGRGKKMEEVEIVRNE